MASFYDAAVETAVEPSSPPPRSPAARPVNPDDVSLRDYFAGQALCGLLASPNCRSTFNERTIAHMAFEVADAMLAARQK